MTVAQALLLFNIIHTFVIFDFMRLMYQPKYSIKWVYAAGCTLFYILDCLVNFQKIAALNILFEGVIFQLFSYFLFKKDERKFYFNFLFFIYYIFLDVIIFAATSSFSDTILSRQLEENVLFRFFVNYFLLIFTYRYVVRLFKNLHRNLPIRRGVFLKSLMIWQIIVVMYFVHHMADDYGKTLLFFLISFIGLDICIIYLFSYIERHGSAMAELQLQRQQTAMLHQHILDMEEKNDIVRRLAHDFRSHLSVARQLADGRKEEAYLSQLSDRLTALSRKVYTGNEVLDIILHNAALRAYEKQIAVEFALEEIDWGFIDPFAITTIFSNLLNNALESCEALERGKIKICFCKRNAHAVVVIRNSCDAARIKYENGALLTTKADHAGIGLGNVAAAVEKYGGKIKFAPEGGEFVVKIAIPLL